MPQPNETVYLGFGSNMGDRLGYIRRAVRSLSRVPEIEVLAVSAVYESPAMTAHPEATAPPYLNAAAAIRTSLSPEELLDMVLRIEQQQGRRRSPGQRWASRTLDIDILLYGSRHIDRPGLTVPHSGVPERAFVLLPLMDLNPKLVVPEPVSRTVASLLADCPGRDEVIRIGRRIDLTPSREP